jgi:5-amino-6-(5-phospho-D-ribitylamino)uracil phosphatase
VSHLYVSDLDSTLADRRGKLSAFSRRQLNALLEAGLTFTVASARSVHTLAPILEGLALRLPVAELNGAFITDLKTRQPLVCHALASEIAEATIGWALASELPPFVSTYWGGRQHLYPPLVLANAGIAWYDTSRRAAKDQRLRPACDPRRRLAEPIVQLTLIGRERSLVPIARAIEAGFPGLSHSVMYENPYQRGWHWLTVQSPFANKGHALRALAEAAGVALAATTVFGDEINDVPMFQAAGRGVAVANAVPALAAIAHEMIGPHHEDSVVRYLIAATRSLPVELASATPLDRGDLI